MALLPIRYIPDPVLRQEAAFVEKFDRELHKLLDNMFETMVDAHGLGIAAPQVGVSRRVAIIDLGADKMAEPLIEALTNDAKSPPLHGTVIELINPEIVARDGKVSSDEGCLSIPDYRDSIQRAGTVTVRAQNRNGDPYEITAKDLLSYALQHEIDHLHGILFVDHLSRLKKQLFKRWCAKNIPEAGT